MSIPEHLRGIDRVHLLYPTLKHMTLEQAETIRGLMMESNCQSVLEIGTASGKGTAFIAATLEEMGARGKVTTLDRDACMRRPLNAKAVAESLGLSHRVELRMHPRTFITTLMHMLSETPRPQYDMVYLDGGKSWEIAGLVFFLVDKMLKPGGFVVVDDINYRIGNSPNALRYYKHMTEEERNEPQLRKVWDLLIREKYNDARELGRWGVATKPLGDDYDA